MTNFEQGSCLQGSRIRMDLKSTFISSNCHFKNCIVPLSNEGFIDVEHCMDEILVTQGGYAIFEMTVILLSRGIFLHVTKDGSYLRVSRGSSLHRLNYSIHSKK